MLPIATRALARRVSAHALRHSRSLRAHVLVSGLRPLHVSRCAANAPLDLAQEMQHAKARALEKQADSGAGAQPIVQRPPPPAGTIEVTIGGESSPIAPAPPAAQKDGKYPAGILTLEEHDRHADPSIQRKDADWTLSHPLWKDTYVGQVSYTHLPPKDFVDKAALWTIKTIRFNFDWMSGYSFGALTIQKALTRVVFLETIAGVPGSVAATIRHLASLRRMKRDGGWINSLLAEAENERMHLLTFLTVRQPGPFIKAMVFLSQGVFFNFFFMAYLISPRFCHRLVGYLEEEAVVTYTKMLQNIEAGGDLKRWATDPAPEIAKKYWSLKPDATMRDVIAHVRADEAHHRDVNHALGTIGQDELNPFRGRA